MLQSCPSHCWRVAVTHWPGLELSPALSLGEGFPIKVHGRPHPERGCHRKNEKHAAEETPADTLTHAGTSQGAACKSLEQMTTPV